MGHLLYTSVGCLLACATLAPPVAAIDIVVNGDFEEPPVRNLVNGWDIYYAGTSFPGWTVGGHSIDIVFLDPANPGGTDCWSASSGYQSVDLNGFGPGSISQDLSTVVGHDYQLSFMMAGNVVGGPFHVTMEFLWQNAVVGSIGFDVGSHDGYDVGWTRHEYTLTALTDLTRLTFHSLVASGPRGPALDDVQVHDVSASVPDSGPGILAGLVFGGTLLWGRRQQVK